MKVKKLLLSCLLSFLMLLFSVLPAFAALPNKITDTVIPPKPNGAVVFPAGASTNVDWEGLADDMWELLFTGTKRSIDISKYHIPVSDANKNAIFFPCWYEPRLLRTAPVSFSKDAKGEYYAELKNLDKGNTIATDPAENRIKYDACANAVAQLTYGIKGNDAISPADKCLLLHDRLAVWTAYDYEGYYGGTLPDDSPDYTAYGPLVNHLGVCNGYALAYNWLLEDVGIRAWYENSDVLDHGWSKVELDNELYYVDVTWDDDSFEDLDNRDIPGRVLHENFLQCFEHFSAGHLHKTDFDQTPSSEIYEKYFSQGSETEIVRINDDYYYIEDGVLWKRTADGGVADLFDINSSKIVGGIPYPMQPKMTAIGSKILYLTPDEVRVYDTMTGDDALAYTPSAAIMRGETYRLNGLRQVDGTVFVTSVNSADGSFDASTVTENTESFVYCTHPTWESLESMHGEERRICPACRALQIDHTFTKKTTSAATLKTAATCTEPAVYYYTCANCGVVASDDAYTFTSGNSAGHSWQWVADVEPTCGTGGMMHQVCKACGETRSANTAIDPTGEHSYTAQTISENALQSAATCTTPASYYYSCAVCGAVEKNDSHTFQNGDPIAHRYTAETVKADALKSVATCTVPATYYYSCAVCGAVEQNDSHTFTDGEALGHNWQWAIDTEATCAVAGSKHEVCTRCDATRNENTTIDPTGAHSYTAQTISENTLQSAATCTAPATYYYSCAVCGAAERNDEHTFTSGDPVAHTYTSETVKSEALKSAATCTAAASYYYSCDVCGAVERNDEHTFTSGDPIAHTFTAETVKADALKSAATCTAPASYYYSCAVCGAVEKNDEHTFTSGDPIAHSWSWVTDTAPTCGTAGAKHEECGVCHAKRNENTTIDPTGEHSYTAQTVSVDALKSAATCTTPASYYYSCAVCGAVEKNDSHTFQNGAPIVHSWKWVTDSAPTCGTAGAKHEECGVCHAKRNENTAIDPTGEHSYTAQIVSVDALKSAATCTTPASYYYSCTVCGNVEKNSSHTFTSGTALGHAWQETARVDANCTKAGTVTYTCTHDRSHVRTEALPQTDHADHNGDGYCDSCGKDLWSNRCAYCGQVHAGFFGAIVGFFHRILALFK